MPIYSGLGYKNYLLQPVNTAEIADTYTFIAGRHTLKLGLDARKDQFTNEDLGGNSGTLGFGQFQTAAAPNTTTTGDGFASLLLGRVNSGAITLQSRAPRFDQQYYAGIVQDDYKIAHNLLLNLGLRYSVEKPLGVRRMATCRTLPRRS